MTTPTQEERDRALAEAMRALFRWAQAHEEATIPMPVFHRYMSKVDGGDCPQWRVAMEDERGVVKIEAFSDPVEAVVALARSLSSGRRAYGGLR